MDPILEVVERSNQRGERMLSVVDLIEAGTLEAPLATWAIVRILDGASYLVGASPGGAGKTTIMSALLAMLPPLAPGRAIRLAVRGTGWERSVPGDCVVAFEIGQGPYEAYIWGEQVVLLAALARQGVRIVSNLHADTLDEARGQIVGQCGAAPRDFDALGVFLPIRYEHGTGHRAGRRDPQRRVVEAICHDGQGWRSFSARDAAAAAADTTVPRVAAAATATAARTADAADEAASGTGNPERLQATIAFLAECRRRGLRRVEDVRRAWLEHLAQGL